MKILFLIDNLGSGGAQRQLATIAPHIKQQGIDVEILCYFKDDFFLSVLESANIPIYWSISDSVLKRIYKVRQFIRKGKYDAVISFLDTPDLLNCIAAIGGHSWKVITSERSAKESTFHTFKGKIIAWFKRKSDYIVCNSDNARKLWLKYYPSYESKLKVIYNIVTLPEVTSNYIPLKEEKLHIIVAASYQYLKNPINVIKAINLLSDDDKSKLKIDWYGEKEVIKGDTRAYDEAIDLIQKNNLGEVIQLNEPTKDIINIMCQADIIGLFSRIEGLPNTICEGLSLGKPVIMSRVSDYSILVDESNGFLCNWDNPETIKSAFINAINLTDNDLLNMGKKSREKAEKMFSPKIILNQWIKIIKND